MSFIKGTTVIHEEAFRGQKLAIPCMIAISEIVYIRQFSEQETVVRLKNGEDIVLLEGVEHIFPQMKAAGVIE